MMALESGQLTTGEQRQSNQEVLFNLIITTNCGTSGKSGDNQITLILKKSNCKVNKIQLYPAIHQHKPLNMYNANILEHNISVCFAELQYVLKLKTLL